MSCFEDKWPLMCLRAIPLPDTSMLEAYTMPKNTIVLKLGKIKKLKVETHRNTERHKFIKKKQYLSIFIFVLGDPGSVLRVVCNELNIHVDINK